MARITKGQEGKSQNICQCNQHPIALEDSGERCRIGEVPPTIAPNLSRRLGQVQGAFMELVILAGIIAAAAVVAKIGDLREIAIGESAFPMQGRENRAIALAIAAGVANFRLAAGFL